MVSTAHRLIRNAWLKISASKAGLDLSRLILHQIRWIDHVVDPPSLSSSSLEVLSVLSSMSSFSRRARLSLLDLISALPNFLAGDDPSRVDDVVVALRDVRVEDPAALVLCLDALGPMRLTFAHLRDVTADAIEALDSADVWSLLALCKFLAQSGMGAMCGEVVEALRRMGLGFDADNDDSGGATGEGKGGRGSESTFSNVPDAGP